MKKPHSEISNPRRRPQKVTSIACTFGDPTSIGPEVGAKAILKLAPTFRGPIFVFAPLKSLPAQLKPLLASKKLILKSTSPDSQNFKPGHPSIHSARCALNDLEAAIRFCKNGNARAMVTGPVDKALCSKVMPSFRGHTEMLKMRTQSQAVTMVLAGPSLRVALVTTHIPISKVTSALSREKIISTAFQFHDYLLQFKKRPRIAVLGLNPHASDKGLIGKEENLVIEPAIRALRKAGKEMEGPFSADSFFFSGYKNFDGVVAMYHDQGLIPLKMLDFDSAVNITLGLPFLRFSVDHGTAFDIAGRGVASSKSYEEALRLAILHTN